MHNTIIYCMFHTDRSAARMQLVFKITLFTPYVQSVNSVFFNRPVYIYCYCTEYDFKLYTYVSGSYCSVLFSFYPFLPDVHA